MNRNNRPTAGERLEYVWLRAGPVALAGSLFAALFLAFIPFLDAGEPTWPLWGDGAITIALVIVQVARALFVEGGFVRRYDGAKYVFFTDDVDRLDCIPTTHAQWVEHRGGRAASVLSKTTAYVSEDPPVVRGMRVSYALGWVQEIRLADEKLCTGDHRHELDHVLAWDLFSDRDDWSQLTHDERIALLDEATSDE